MYSKAAVREERRKKGYKGRELTPINDESGHDAAQPRKSIRRIEPRVAAVSWFV
jgi:hypothetical protein